VCLSGQTFTHPQHYDVIILGVYPHESCDVIVRSDFRPNAVCYNAGMRHKAVIATFIGTAIAASISVSIVRAQTARSVNDGVFSADQAKRGETVYTDNCATCHDPMLTGGVGPALTGMEFITAWKEMTVGDLFDRIKTTMPLTSPGTLTPEQAADVLSFILNFNKFPAGSAPLPTDLDALKGVKMAEPGAAKTGSASPGAAPAGAALYAAVQAKRGETVYTDNCAACHDPKLTGGVGPALAGKEFATSWKTKSVGELLERIQTTMPLTSPGSLMPQQSADVVAFILSSNQYPAGATELAVDATTLKAATLGEPPQK
jgi:mono/diheme cytochrome c family protein